MPGKEMLSFIACFVICGQVNSMGDRWAWGSDVSSRRSQLDTDTKNEVKEIEVENDFSPVDIVEDKNQRTARKVETETPEARFFLKDKLCAIGLADVSEIFKSFHLNFQFSYSSVPMICPRQCSMFSLYK